MMKDLRKAIEDNYLTFITITTTSVIFIAALVWVITLFVKKVKKDK